MSRPFVFFDRDGTLVEDRVYAHRPEDCVPLPGALEAVRRVRKAGYGTAIVTNQSGIGRGYFDQAAFERFQARLAEQLAAAGTAIDATYWCPHRPEDACPCRKPATGLIERACQQFDVDLTRSWVVGDKPCDVELARHAGCRAVLVQSDTGTESRDEIDPEVPVARDLAAAVDYILRT